MGSKGTYRRERYIAHREEIIERNRQWRKRNRKKFLEILKKYRESPKGKAQIARYRLRRNELKRRRYAENKERVLNA